MKRPPSAAPLGSLWTALLGRWVEFARAAVALPDDAAGAAWKASVTPLITLQALTHALDEIDDFDDDERDLALDKAELLIDDATDAILNAWSGQPVPEGIREAMDDARDAWCDAVNAGWMWVVTVPEFVAGHPGDVAAAAEAIGFRGTLMLPAPGVPLFETCPAATLFPGASDQQALGELAAIVQEFLGPEVAVARARTPVQVYRRLDFIQGRPVEDVVAALDGDPLPGQPLLVPVVIEGESQPVHLPPRPGPAMDPVPVRWPDHAGESEDDNAR